MSEKNSSKNVSPLFSFLFIVIYPKIIFIHGAFAYQENVVSGLQAIVEVDTERGLGDGECIPLRNDLTDQVFLHQVSLLHHLSSVEHK